jgi:hypothetical protein
MKIHFDSPMGVVDAGSFGPSLSRLLFSLGKIPLTTVYVHGAAIGNHRMEVEEGKCIYSDCFRQELGETAELQWR